MYLPNQPGPLIVDLKGPRLEPQEHELLCHPNTGGVIFFSRNFESTTQLKQLIDDIRAVRPELLLCVDQEGGRVQRFRKGFTRLPAAGEILNIARRSGCSADRLSHACGALMASELAAFDIDFSFAPVADIDYGNNQVIGDRAFGKTPEDATQLALAFYEGMQSVGMAGVAKHFPGHGHVAEDTHTDIALDERDFEALDKDLVPFVSLLQAGIEGVMPSHVIYTRLDSLPAVQSMKIIQGMLRDTMGFQGCVISDDLAMAGASSSASINDRVIGAMNAGCDMIMCCNLEQGNVDALDTLSEIGGSLLMAPASVARRKKMKRKDVDIAGSETEELIDWCRSVLDSAAR